MGGALPGRSGGLDGTASPFISLPASGSCAGPITVPVARRLGPPGGIATLGGGGLMTQLSDRKRIPSPS
jgi:hypothetical protein